MARRLQQILMRVLQTDSTAQQVNSGWQVRCLHCRSPLLLSARGTPISAATLEHIVPQSWFGKRSAIALTGLLTGPQDLRNLAIACARCNQSKGVRHDPNPSDVQAQQVVTALLAKRAQNWRDEL